jgi:hypothetical protein
MAMYDYIVAGASLLEDVPRFVDVLKNSGVSALLLESCSMSEDLPLEWRPLVNICEKLPDVTAPVIPLTEYWLTQAIQRKVANIDTIAMQASRSKYYVSKVLSEAGLRTLHRRYLEDITPPFPDRYLARLDAAYSSHSILRYVENGPFNPAIITKKVKGDAGGSMHTILDIAENRIIVENYLLGEEYSADVFARRGQITVLRIFMKVVTWTNGRPLCDSYIAVPCNDAISSSIRDWCQVLFGSNCTCFGQLDFIVNEECPFLIDFSCRIGSGLDAIKRFAGLSSYVGLALCDKEVAFAPYMVQKHIMPDRQDRLSGFRYDLPSKFEVTVHKATGSVITNNICSAAAKIADICFFATDLNDAKDQARSLNSRISLVIDD